MVRMTQRVMLAGAGAVVLFLAACGGPGANGEPQSPVSGDSTPAPADQSTDGADGPTEGGGATGITQLSLDPDVNPCSVLSAADVEELEFALEDMTMNRAGESQGMRTAFDVTTGQLESIPPRPECLWNSADGQRVGVYVATADSCCNPDLEAIDLGDGGTIAEMTLPAGTSVWFASGDLAYRVMVSGSAELNEATALDIAARILANEDNQTTYTAGFPVIATSLCDPDIASAAMDTVGFLSEYYVFPTWTRASSENAAQGCSIGHPDATTGSVEVSMMGSDSDIDLCDPDRHVTEVSPYELDGSTGCQTNAGVYLAREGYQLAVEVLDLQQSDEDYRAQAELIALDVIDHLE